MATKPPRTPITTSFISLAEAGEVLGVHSRTISRYIATGQLTGYRIGDRLVRVKRADVDSLVQPIPTARRR